MVIAVDFDNTIVKWKEGGIVYPVKYVVDFLKRRKDMGDTLILWTSREGQELEWAVNLCKEWGIQIDYANENTKEVIKSGRDPRKIEADLYVDAKSVNSEHEWQRLKFLLMDEYI